MSCYGVTATVLCITTLVFCIIGFVTPLWLVSWEQKHSAFHRIGLWEVCFTAFTDPKMFAYKYYNGCWWIFHSELDAIRDMLNPAWFKAVQGFAVLTLLSSFIAVIAMIISRCKKSKRNMGNNVMAAFTFLTCLFAFLSVIVFGSCAKDPRMYRLPWPQYNYFSAGFGMMIMCALSAGFGFAFILGDKSVGNDDDSIDEKRRR